MIRNLFFCKEWVASFLAMHKLYILTVPALNFCTCSPSSLGQDLMVKNAKNKNKTSFGLLELEMAVLRCFFLKKRPLSFKD
jgi:hypothetical protein